MKLSDYSLATLCTEFKKNRHVIKAYLAGETVEHNGDGLILGMTTGVFLLILVLSLALFIWSVWALITYSSTMPTWAIILSVLLYVFSAGGASILVLIIVYVTKGTAPASKGRSSRSRR